MILQAILTLGVLLAVRDVLKTSRVIASPGPPTLPALVPVPMGSRPPLPAEPQHADNAAPADLSAWGHADPLTLRQAAALWAKQDPAALATKPLRGTPAAWLQALVQAAETGGLSVTANTDPGRPLIGSPIDHAWARRSELARFAVARGEAPPFLAAHLVEAVAAAEPDFEPAPEDPPEPTLWLESAKFSYDAFSSGDLDKCSLTLDVQNKTYGDLGGVTVSVSEMATKGGERIVPVGTNVLVASKPLRRRDTLRIRMLSRDAGKRGPWLLHLTGGLRQQLALDEGTSFQISMTAESGLMTRAVLKVALRNGKTSQCKITAQAILPQ
ncbi:hypothetical protein [Devosia sp.]|uniref:hypothetical protein n=1 Tax=Devosia sp. TaxID=1871048 RepID=UPI002FCCA412